MDINTDMSDLTTEQEVDLLTLALYDLDSRLKNLESIPSKTSGDEGLPESGEFATEEPALKHLIEIVNEGPWYTDPTRDTKCGWDRLVDPWIDIMPFIGEKIPSAYRIWQSGKRYAVNGDIVNAERCDRLNYLLHNSYVPHNCDFRGEIIFAYGGIGCIIHKDATVHAHVTIGANVTLGGRGKIGRIDPDTGKRMTVPEIGPLTNIGACANITGGVTIGALSIVAPNAVVTKSCEPGTILAGVPAKPLKVLTMDTVLRYKYSFLAARKWSDEQFLNFASQHLS
ncbi:MAG: hypothetical protein MR654_04545 [Corynebacterium glucuronolyticum]|nr:hypothetical protein [Corynebacterium glucuronolyticum]